MDTGEDLSLVTQDLAEQIRLWRQHHRPPARFPLEIWQKATEIAGQLGVSKAARALRLDYMSLKRRMGLPVRARQQKPETTFLEWLPPLPGVIAECLIDVTSASGARMSVRMKSLSPAALGTVLRDFVGQP